MLALDLSLEYIAHCNRGRPRTRWDGDFLKLFYYMCDSNNWLLSMTNSSTQYLKDLDDACVVFTSPIWSQTSLFCVWRHLFVYLIILRARARAWRRGHTQGLIGHSPVRIASNCKSTAITLLCMRKTFCMQDTQRAWIKMPTPDTKCCAKSMYK